MRLQACLKPTGPARAPAGSAMVPFRKAGGKAARASTSARVIARPWETVAPQAPPKTQLQKEHEALLEKLRVVEEDVQHYKFQAASSWGDYAEARKRILRLLDQIDGLHSDVRNEKHARIEAETRLAEATAALEAANAELAQLRGGEQ